MNIDRRRKEECKNANCRLDKGRCLVKYGRDCIRLGGTRIPVQSSVSESFPLSVQAQTTFKPYFIVDGWSPEELEEDEWCLRKIKSYPHYP